MVLKRDFKIEARVCVYRVVGRYTLEPCKMREKYCHLCSDKFLPAQFHGTAFSTHPGLTRNPRFSFAHIILVCAATSQLANKVCE